jgi:hypothetical protein
VNLPPFHPKAEEEMNAEADYYDSKAEDLGSDFLEVVRRVAVDASPLPNEYPLCSIVRQLIPAITDHPSLRSRA